MSRVAAIYTRLPRVLLFAVAALVQVALVALMVFDRMQILRAGREVMLRTQPVDPRDFLRGDYVILTYDISRLPTGDLKDHPATSRMPIYVKLLPNAEGVHQAVAVTFEPVAVSGNEVLIRGNVVGGTNCGPANASLCPNITVTYGIERYFVPEGQGHDLEAARNERRLVVVAAVTAAGRAAIKRLLLDGKAVYDEPLF